MHFDFSTVYILINNVLLIERSLILENMKHVDTYAAILKWLRSYLINLLTGVQKRRRHKSFKHSSLW